MTTQGELSPIICFGQRHGGSLVCHNQASVVHQGAGPELKASSPSEARVWALEIGKDCTFVPPAA